MIEEAALAQLATRAKALSDELSAPVYVHTFENGDELRVTPTLILSAAIFYWLVISDWQLGDLIGDALGLPTAAKRRAYWMEVAGLDPENPADQQKWDAAQKERERLNQAMGVEKWWSPPTTRLGTAIAEWIMGE